MSRRDQARFGPTNDAAWTRGGPTAFCLPCETEFRPEHPNALLAITVHRADPSITMMSPICCTWRSAKTPRLGSKARLTSGSRCDRAPSSSLRSEQLPKAVPQRRFE